MDVFDLSAKLTLDKSEYESGLTDAKEKGDGLGTAFTTAGKVAGAGILAVGTAVAGLTTDIVKGASATAEYGDSIDKNAQKLGLSNKAYQEWDYVLNLAGTSMGNMGTGLKTLTNKLDDAKNGSESAQGMFEKLGISMEDINSMSREDLFEATIKGFQGMADSTERASLANDLFGKSGQELTPLFNTTSEETEKLIQNLNDMGAIMSDDAVKNSADFEDALTTLQTALTGLKNGAMGDFLPTITDIMNGLTKIFGGDNSGIDEINKGVKGFVENLTRSLPTILETGMSIIESLASAIIENIPQILDAGTEVVMELADKIIENLPVIIETGLNVIVSLAEGIADSLPELIPTIVEVVLKITETLIDNIGLLIDGAIALITGLAEGLINSLPILIEKAPEIVLKLVEAVIENAPKLLESAFELIVTLGKGLINSIPELVKQVPELIEALFNKFEEFKDKMKNTGKNLIEGIKDGILGAWDSFKKWIYDKFESIIDGVKDIFGIHSPSRVFATIGEQCVAGFEEGSDEMFSDGGMTAKISADVTGQNTRNDIIELLEEYLPHIATKDSFDNVGITFNSREFGRLVNEVV